MPVLVLSQECTIQISGIITDAHDNDVLELASISLSEKNHFAYSDVNGYFLLENICEGDYHVTINHLGCDQKQLYLHIEKDTFLTIEMEHHNELLQTVTVQKKKAIVPQSTSNIQLKSEQILSKSGQSLGRILHDISGVNSVETGTETSKPMIHGLFGNRIRVIHNNVAINSQNWGLEHAPEIDPYAVNKITVVKGASALKYASNAMGGAVILENEALPTDKHLHGEYSFSGFLNGRKFSNNLKLEGGLPKISSFKWRIQGSYTRSGDVNAPDYYLTNTGNESAGASVALGLLKKKYATTLQYNFYHLRTAILKGSHIGNLTDLEEAFTRDEPFFTNENFSYAIDRPFQQVMHNTIAIEHKQYLDKGQLDISYNFQQNKREEYDVRRSSDKPSIFLNLLSNTVTADYKNKKDIWAYNTGIQFENKVNFNDPSLNAKPLIPNYNQNKIAAYFINTFSLEKLIVDAGVRYEFVNLQAQFYERGELLKPKHVFNNVSVNAGFVYKLHKYFDWRFSTSLVRRAPEVNELYSNGLHHGAAAIERGNSSFNNESMWSLNTGFTYSNKDIISIEFTPYYQYFFNYIDLVLQSAPELTIRGAFPVYNYTASKAHVWGFDFAMQTQVYKNLTWQLKSAIVRGKNLENKSYLAFIPADFIDNSLQYMFPVNKHEINIGAGLRNTWQQARLPDFDFVEAPNGYALLRAELGGKINLNKIALIWQIEANNILNVSYRNYLNRWRYFADEMGAQLAIRLRIKF